MLGCEACRERLAVLRMRSLLLTSSFFFRLSFLDHLPRKLSSLFTNFSCAGLVTGLGLAVLKIPATAAMNPLFFFDILDWLVGLVTLESLPEPLFGETGALESVEFIPSRW